MIEDMIQTSSRPGDLIADFCMGSGTTRAAQRLAQLALPGVFT